MKAFVGMVLKCVCGSPVLVDGFFWSPYCLFRLWGYESKQSGTLVKGCQAANDMTRERSNMDLVLLSTGGCGYFT